MEPLKSFNDNNNRDRISKFNYSSSHEFKNGIQIVKSFCFDKQPNSAKYGKYKPWTLRVITYLFSSEAFYDQLA